MGGGDTTTHVGRRRNPHTCTLVSNQICSQNSTQTTSSSFPSSSLFGEVTPLASTRRRRSSEEEEEDVDIENRSRKQAVRVTSSEQLQHLVGTRRLFTGVSRQSFLRPEASCLSMSSLFRSDKDTYLPPVSSSLPPSFPSSPPKAASASVTWTCGGTPLLPSSPPPPLPPCLPPPCTRSRQQSTPESPRRANRGQGRMG